MDCCRNVHCPEAVKKNEGSGRFYITMGHAGFNTTRNNGDGYATWATAKRVIVGLLNR